MSTQSERLELWKQVAQIISALAVPVVLALIGYYVQRSLADAGLKKDYVQMALGVLKEQPTKEHAELRQWAIAVLDKNSPVSLPPSLKSQLVKTNAFDVFIGDTFQFEQTIECKAVPNPETLEWLIANDPVRYTRCPDGRVGERKWAGTPYLKRRPSATASAPK